MRGRSNKSSGNLWSYNRTRLRRNSAPLTRTRSADYNNVHNANMTLSGTYNNIHLWTDTYWGKITTSDNNKPVIHTDETPTVNGDMMMTEIREVTVNNNHHT